jgi:hypothetical protein
MTRARYLIFLPAIFRHIERHHLARHRDADKVSRDWQDKLRAVLASTEPQHRAGVIGKERQRRIVRPPSSIYWSGFFGLGIAVRSVSESAYLDALADGFATRTIKDDDRTVHDVEDPLLWDPEFKTSSIVSGDGISPRLSFRLEADEAMALRSRYARISPDGVPSLMTKLVEWTVRHGDVEPPAYPWDVPHPGTALERIIGHAEQLSLLARGATLIYNALLFAKAQIRDNGTEAAFEAWHDHARGSLAVWDLEDFAALPCVRRSGDIEDLTFLRDFRDHVAVSSSARAVYLSGDTRKCVRNRERSMRGDRARLRGGHYLRVWQPPKKYDLTALYQLSYRHAVGRRIATDIANGLRSGTL